MQHRLKVTNKTAVRKLTTDLSRVKTTDEVEGCKELRRAKVSPWQVPVSAYMACTCTCPCTCMRTRACTCTCTCARRRNQQVRVTAARDACVAASARPGIGANTAERPYVQVHRFRAFLRCCMRMRCNISAWVVLADAWGCMAVGADAYSRLARVVASAVGADVPAAGLLMWRRRQRACA